MNYPSIHRTRSVGPGFIFVLSICLSSTGARAQYVSLNAKEIRRLAHSGDMRQRYDSLLHIADAALTADPHPIDTIRTEGLLQGDPRKTATQQALRDLPKIYALSLAWRVSSKRKYLEKAAVFLGAWAAANHPRGDPIDDTNLDPAVEAFDLVKEALTSQQAAAIRDWLLLTANTELTAPYNRPGRGTSSNNWHSHRLKIVGEIAFAIGDTTLEGIVVRGLTEQIGRNLNADGSSADFVTRDALHYHVYDLEPLLKLAILLKRATGVDYYVYTAATGSSIKKSVDWVLPFLNGEKTHPEFVNSTVEFDRRRAQNGEAAYKAGTLFEPRNGIATLLLAAYFDPSQMELARKLIGTGDRYPAWQAVVNAVQ